MILNKQITEKLALKSGLNFDKAKDYDVLCDKIYASTKRTIGVNTIKRLMGYIVDDRKTNDYTLNTIAIYLGFKTWDELCGSLRIDSDWNYEDQSVYTEEMPVETKISVKYLNRMVTFSVIVFNGKKMLKVLEASNSSLCAGDILEVAHLRYGQPIEAKKVYRGDTIGNYKTNGELKEIVIT